MTGTIARRIRTTLGMMTEEPREVDQRVGGDNVGGPAEGGAGGAREKRLGFSRSRAVDAISLRGLGSDSSWACEAYSFLLGLESGLSSTAYSWTMCEPPPTPRGVAQADGGVAS
jgi:hypothetical protein